MNLLSQNENIQQHKTLYQYNPPNDVKLVVVVESKYRKTDDTLTMVMQEEVEVKIVNS